MSIIFEMHTTVKGKGPFILCANSKWQYNWLAFLNGRLWSVPSSNSSFLRAIKHYLAELVILWSSCFLSFFLRFIFTMVRRGPVLNQNGELDFECWGVWQFWDFEEVCRLRGLVGPHIWKYWIGINASNLLAGQSPPSVKTLFCRTKSCCSHF